MCKILYLQVLLVKNLILNFIIFLSEEIFILFLIGEFEFLSYYFEVMSVTMLIKGENKMSMTPVTFSFDKSSL
mgnify:FL=1